jgi:7,8-dihydropterin-6-yl-methyl-4-(beta-D-ribofuranosyl)aminobenzene 5'-phosphate synthase
MDIKISIVVDNYTDNGLLTEHGLSFFIQAGDTEILFDTGQGTALENNLIYMGISLKKTDAVVLSHGHYDHGGALKYVLQNAENAIFYAHPGIMQKRWSIRDNNVRPVHLPEESRLAIEKQPPGRTHFDHEPFFLTPEIGLTGFIPRESDFDNNGDSFYLDEKARTVDPLADDMALFIRKNNELIICLGCCHAGLINTVNHIQKLNPGMKIKAIIGGLHLVYACPEYLQKTMEKLNEFDPELIIPCHCTGQKAIIELQNTFDHRVLTGAAGQIYHF